MMTSLIPKRSWCQLLKQVDDLLSSQQSTASELLELNPNRKAAVIEALQSYEAIFDDFKQYARFSPLGYTKNLVTDIRRKRSTNYDAGNVIANIMVMCWAPGQLSAFHGHEGSRCFVKVLKGQLLEEREPHPNHQLECQSERQKSIVLSENDVVYIDDQLGCHRVTNSSPSEPAITLHVYVPPYRKCRIFHTDCENMTQSSENLSMFNSEVVDVNFYNEEIGA